MTTIIGVDFSGAIERHNKGIKTWAAQGQLLENGTLLLESAKRIRRDPLYNLLAHTDAPAVVAMDFPFGVPAAFADRLSPDRKPTTMPEVWKSIAKITPDEFIAARHQFVADYKDPRQAGIAPLPASTLYCHPGEPQRAGDAKYLSGPFSPLHNAAPSMPQMTYHGMQLLRRLHNETPSGRWHVPPMEPTAPPESTVTLLELMPGAFLQVCGLPSKYYKGELRRHWTLRHNILDRLPARAGWPVLDLSNVQDDCIANDDCLDAVVAAVCAASWARCQDHFHHPTAEELADAQLEGWIYIPKAACAIPSAC